MAQAPKSTKKDNTTTGAGKGSGAAKKASKDPEAKVEDAVVIGETPPKASTGTGAPAGKGETPPAAKAKSDPGTTAPEPTGKGPAKPTSRPADNRKTTTQTVPPGKVVEKPVSPAGAKSGDASSTKPDAPKAPAAKRGGLGSFLGLLLGGVAAAVIGFAAARTIVPEGWPFPGVAPEEDPLVGAVEAQGAEIAALEARLGALDATLAEVQSDTSGLDALGRDLSARLDKLGGGAADIAAQLVTIETRLSAVEKLAPEGTEAARTAAAAYARELEALREMFAGELAEIDAAQADASALEAQLAESAKAASGRAALARVLAALDTGEPFDTALGELTAATGVDAPAALTEVAAAGVPALVDLLQNFPDAARKAIDADLRAGVEDGSLNRMQAFMRTQLGTRSLEPKDGDDADAVLSRAEAALKAGDLDTALAEIEALPEAAKPAFAAWQAQAKTRAEALAASAALADELNAK